MSLDSNGNWLGGFCKFLGSGSSLLAELWDTFLGIEMAKGASCQNLIIESDCLIAVNLIKQGNIPYSHFFYP